MKARDLKDKYIKFFESKGHKEIPSARLVPENDSTTLFISAGMHPLVPYLLGQPHPLGARLVDVQKCVRTGDIEEVGDECHHTFFEMLGNWSLGDYFKKEAIEYSYEFLTKVLNIDNNNLSVTCFAGDDDAPKDTESAEIWERLGIKDIKFLPKKDNWWGPAGTTGPCGPDTEMFYDGLEIWNDVFMQYNKNAKGEYEKLTRPNVDTGMGVERTTAVLSGLNDDYLTDIFQPIIKKIEELSGLSYVETRLITSLQSTHQKSMRIISDHIRSAVFIIADGVEPNNKEAGYVLRRLIRRAIREGKNLGMENNFCKIVAQSVLDNQDNYAGIYPELDLNKNKILEIIENEEIKFRKTLESGLHEINKLIIRNHQVSGSEAFNLYQSYGFPVEMIEEELDKNNLCLDIDEFNKLKTEHAKKSKTLSAGKFKSGLADDSHVVTKYHTATHLLHAALRNILGEQVQQSGSNITSNRLRFDFTYHSALTLDEIKKVEDFVNDNIKKNLPVMCQIMPLEKAKESGALHFFGNKYPSSVSVYSVGNVESWVSKEICTGPHVENTGIMGKFKIIKQESAGSGKRRVYAILE